jgi:5-methyltetrahydrofolate--homocysteine methyltransferase
MLTTVSSASKEVIIGNGRPVVLIGERINPTGKKMLSESLIKGSMEIVRKEALAQVQAGADIIDVNVVAFGVDETILLPQAVQAVMESVESPICLDSTKTAAIAAALKVYKGKPIINSVTGEEHSLNTVLPIVKEYGASVIGLVQDDDGIPKDAERRVEIARKIVDRAEAMGISRDNILIDCMAFAIGAEPGSAKDVFSAIERIRKELGVNIVLAASNISFGLPERGLLNNAFMTMAIASGATCLIVDVAKARPAVLAAELILGTDKYARRYIQAYRQSQKGREK